MRDQERFFKKVSTPMPMWGYSAGGGMGWWMILSSLFWLALAGIAVWVLVSWLGRASRSTTPPQMPPQLSALDILKARYARGEIDTATYQFMHEQLEEPVAISAQKAISGGQ